MEYDEIEILDNSLGDQSDANDTESEYDCRDYETDSSDINSGDSGDSSDSEVENNVDRSDTMDTASQNVTADFDEMIVTYTRAKKQNPITLFRK